MLCFVKKCLKKYTYILSEELCEDRRCIVAVRSSFVSFLSPLLKVRFHFYISMQFGLVVAVP